MWADHPHVPAALAELNGCYVLEQLLIHSFFRCWYVASWSAHTHTSQRDVKQIPLSELFDSVCEMGTPIQPVDPTPPTVLVWSGAWQPAEL